MADPLSLVALGAAVGGATGRFVEKAYDSGQKWIATYFADHKQKAVDKAQANSADFLRQLADRIKLLEDQTVASPEQIETAQDHPDFSVILQKALLTAAQTDNDEKHQLLARILAERLVAPPEGMLAMVSKLACDVIGFMTPNQLRLLGLVANLLYVKPTDALPANAYSDWFVSRFAPYMNTNFTNLDLTHLESLSCLKYTPILSRDLTQVLSDKNKGTFDKAIIESPLGNHIKTLWTQGLQSVDLSSVGELIGIYVFDLLSGTNTEIRGMN